MQLVVALGSSNRYDISITKRTHSKLDILSNGMVRGSALVPFI